MGFKYYISSYFKGGKRIIEKNWLVEESEQEDICHTTNEVNA
jgi:hypothetical protein